MVYAGAMHYVDGEVITQINLSTCDHFFLNQIISAAQLSNVFENVNNNKLFDKLRYSNKPAQTKKNCRGFLLGYSVLFF